MLACIPLAALHSALSAFLRSFAAPVMIALVMAGISTVLLQLKVTAVLAIPYGLLTHSTQLGTILVSGQKTTFDASDLSVSSVGFVFVATLVMTALIVAVTTWILNRSDTRA